MIKWERKIEMKDLQLKYQNTLYELVKLESENQIRKWGIQDHEPSEWLMFLTEEHGELARSHRRMAI